MRKTMTLTVDRELADFIQNLPGMVDPSALINELFHADMKARGITINPQLKQQFANDPTLQEAELLLDEDTHAAE